MPLRGRHPQRQAHGQGGELGTEPSHHAEGSPGRESGPRGHTQGAGRCRQVEQEAWGTGCQLPDVAVSSSSIFQSCVAGDLEIEPLALEPRPPHPRWAPGTPEVTRPGGPTWTGAGTW